MFPRKSLKFLVILALLVIPMVTLAAPPEPVPGSANVDGDASEWTSADFFADMYLAAHPDNAVLAKLYLRYDCLASGGPVLYAYVAVESGHTIDADAGPDEQYIKDNNSTKVNNSSGDDGTPPDFAWVNLSGDGTTADGWEASTYWAPGTYTKLNVHAQIDNQQTSAVANRSIDLELACGPLAISLNTATANATGNPLVAPVALLVGTLLVATTLVIRSRRSHASYH